MKIYELISPLFWGVEWDTVRIFHIMNKGDEDSKVKHEVITNNPHIRRESSRKRILIGIENHCDRLCTENIEEIIGTEDLENTIGYYFTVKKKHQAVLIARKMRVISQGELEIYGVDPDYFFSLVPLTGRARKKIEKYILDLKVDFTIREKLKYFIKKMLIITGISGVLYEKFLITVGTLPGREFERYTQ